MGIRIILLGSMSCDFGVFVGRAGVAIPCWLELLKTFCTRHCLSMFGCVRFCMNSGFGF